MSLLVSEQESLQLRDDSFIAGWMISPDLCDKIIENFKQNEHLAEERGDFRNYKVITNQKIHSKLNKEYELSLFEVLKLYIIKYPSCYVGMGKWKLDSKYNIQQYLPEKSYNRWHCEFYGPEKGKRVRHLVFMTYLNTIDDGGETQFLYQHLKLQPKKGLTVVWPVNWTHMHRGLPAKTEKKYIVTGWCSFIEENHGK